MKHWKEKLLLSILVVAVSMTTLTACGTSASLSAPEGLSAEVSAEETGINEKIGPAEAIKIMEAGEPYYLLDIRSIDEWKTGRAGGSTPVTLDDLALFAELNLHYTEFPIFVHAADKETSKAATDKLSALGYEAVYDMGTVEEWPLELTIPNEYEIERELARMETELRLPETPETPVEESSTDPETPTDPEAPPEEPSENPDTPEEPSSENPPAEA